MTAVAVSDVLWETVCNTADLLPERGVAVLVERQQFALFLLADGSLRAVDNRDPFSAACVLSRGIVGSRGGRPVVASPMFKQSFDLDTGECLDDPTVAITSYPVRIVDGAVELGIPRM